MKLILLNEEKGRWKEFVKIFKSGRIIVFDEFWDKEQGCFIVNNKFKLTKEASLKLKESLMR